MRRSGCALCGARESRFIYRGTDRLYRTTTEIFEVVECLHCCMARLDPRPSDLTRYYPPLYWFPGGPANTYRRFVLRDHVRFVVQAMGAGTRVLDAGSGGGLLAALLRERGVAACALDISHAATALAGRNGAPSVAADFAHAPFRDGAWDVIAMFHVIEHVPDPRQHLKAAHRLLAAGGRLVIAAPNFDSLQRRIFRIRWNGLDLPRHLHHFRARDLQLLLEQTGFHVTRTRYFSWRDSPAGLATTLVPGLDPMARIIRNDRGHQVYDIAATALYAGLTALSVPFVVLEAAMKRGATVLMEAVRL